MQGEDPVLKRLRAVCLALPGTHETVTFGHPTFRAGKSSFAVLEEYKGRLCICVKSTLAEQDLLVQDPRFFVAPYVGRHGWVSYIAEGKIDWTMITELVNRSHRLVAPKRTLKARNRTLETP